MPQLTPTAAATTLGLKRDVPLSITSMAKCLRVAFFPNGLHSPQLADFLKKLELALVHSGVQVITYEQALREGHDGRIPEGIVLFAPGESQPGNLAIDHISSLSKNVVVGVLDGTFPGIFADRFQKRVNTLVGALVWHMAHLVIYVDDESWTICNMNGAIETFSLNSLQERTANSLVPKLAAPVTPLQRSEYELQPDKFDPLNSEHTLSVRDMVAGSHAWGRTGLLASRIRLDELKYRNHRYKRIAAAYLSCRTGMSYGFLARQLPTKIQPALYLCEAHPLLQQLDWDQKDYLELDHTLLISPKIGNARFLVTVPEVSVVCTRSGCEKNRLDPMIDLIMVTLRSGRVMLSRALATTDDDDCQPSFDTMTILSHAVANSIIASILERIRPRSKFAFSLTKFGLGLAHWHGFLHESMLPPGFYIHGNSNPPVSCSTHQAALFAMLGKLGAFERSVEERCEFLGDFHVEPSHGTNVTGPSLVTLAQIVSGGEADAIKQSQ